MINISTVRRKYIVKPDHIDPDTYEIEYRVLMGGTVIFIGRSRYFGGDFEVDCSDFIESAIAANPREDSHSILVYVNFYFMNEAGYPLEMVQSVTEWRPMTLNLHDADHWDIKAMLRLYNCGFLFGNSGGITIPLAVQNGMLVGKTINYLDKTTYSDKYGDIHNGSMTNRYELECYVDPEWLRVTTGNDNEYEKVAIALQNALVTDFYAYQVEISGMVWEQIPDSGYEPEEIMFECRVKDVEKIETSSSYSVEKRIPTYKITIEVYR